MKIDLEENEKGGRFFIPDGNNYLAEMTYSMAGDVMIIDHTEVSETLEGKGIGKQLVHHAVEFARTKNVKILPLCPFAKSVFDRIAEYRDVLR